MRRRLQRYMAVVAAALIVCMAGVIPASACSLFQTVEEAGAEEVTDSEAALISGDGLLSALAGGLAGAIFGGASYTVDYLWDKYIQHEERTFSVSDYYQSVVSSALIGTVSGALAGYL